MISGLGVENIVDYLRHTGWTPRPERWRGASIWSLADGHDVLVPARDGTGDGALRVREIVDVLALVEQRSRQDVVTDISSPLVDTQWIRTFPDDLPSGFTTLGDGLSVLSGVGGALRAAARAAVGEEHAGAVERLLARVQLGTARPGSFVVPVRVPVDEPPPDDGALPLGRRVTLSLHDAVAVLSGATAHGEESSVDEVVAAGVSADLCESLGDLGGEDRRAPFEIGFRWARSLPSDVPASTFGFERGAGAVLRAAAEHRRRLGAPVLVGEVRSLQDDASREDRWRIEVVPGDGGRTTWVRLLELSSYVKAIVAHRDRRRVRVRGTVTGTGRKTELTADPGGLEVLD
ncbi:hypothetical protein [Umezawaea beigongshangensis]|uniref:hypothetical protein n=1 Tax=Umezawaea beigongshangensis TaxID=2780383 RepID=UPI0018F26399|nr:hypothetical protein [Umezawaea beigongshangensis]